MSDEALRALRREAEASRDGGAWLRLATLLAREGRHDEASLAVLTAEELGQDGGEVLESFAPARFAARPLDAGPPRPDAMPCLAWSKDGRTLYVLEHAPDRTVGIVAWDVVAGRARAVALNLPIPSALALAVAPDGRLLVGYREQRGGVRLAFVERGFLQPPIGEGHQAFHEIAVLGEHVLACDGTRVRAWKPGATRASWALRGWKVALDATGTVAVLDGEELALHDPLARKPRRRIPFATSGTPFTARRRALVLDERSIVLVDGERLVERAVARRPDALVPSPSGVQVVVNRLSEPASVLDLRTGDEQPVPLPGYVRHSAWSPSGRRLAVANGEGGLILLEGV